MNGIQAAEKKTHYVLVVDAAVNDRFYTCMLLQEFGYTVFSTHTAREAIEFMTLAPPSAILVDADLNGSELYFWLSKNPRFLDIPFIILSWRPNAAVENRAERGGFSAYLQKPANTEEFYQIVQIAIEQAPRRNIRLRTRLMARLDDGLDPGEGYITALSEFGLFFRTLVPRPINTYVPVRFAIHDRMIVTEAVVLYTVSFDEGPFKEPGMGMKFTNISRADRALIGSYLLQRIDDVTMRMRPYGDTQ